MIDFDWVTIPAGEFLMGSDPTRDTQAFDDEKPQHKVLLPAYRIARVPVTVAQFMVFVKETGHEWTVTVKGRLDLRRKANHPVTFVSWHDAQAFCAWADVRLPTEAEWEKAARGVDGRIWPWGDQEPDQTRCNFDIQVGDTTSVRKFSAGKSKSIYGLFDMAGNVWEWTSSLKKRYPYKTDDRREDPKAGGARVLRGGSFYSGARLVRCASRSGNYPACRYDFIGFRVVAYSA